VHKLDGEEQFEMTIRENVKAKVSEEYYEENEGKIQHLITLGKNYVFDKEWSFE
jgi:hypothetical protein